MHRASCYGCVCMVATLAWFAMRSAGADEFSLGLRVESGERKVETGFTDEQPSTADPHRRPIFQAVAGETLHVIWQAKYLGQTRTYKDILVHYFVTPEQEVGQQVMPPLGKVVPHEGAVTLDFKPAVEVHGEFTIAFQQEGNYLLRVETRGLIDQVQHEDFTALDIVVK